MNHWIDRRGLIVGALYTWLAGCALTGAALGSILYKRLRKGHA